MAPGFLVKLGSCNSSITRVMCPSSVTLGPSRGCWVRIHPFSKKLGIVHCRLLNTPHQVELTCVSDDVTVMVNGSRLFKDQSVNLRHRSVVTIAQDSFQWLDAPRNSSRTVALRARKVSKGMQLILPDDQAFFDGFVVFKKDHKQLLKLKSSQDTSKMEPSARSNFLYREAELRSNFLKESLVQENQRQTVFQNQDQVGIQPWADPAFLSNPGSGGSTVGTKDNDFLIRFFSPDYLAWKNHPNEPGSEPGTDSNRPVYISDSGSVATVSEQLPPPPSRDDSVVIFETSGSNRTLDSWMTIQEGFLPFLMKLQFKEPFGLTNSERVTKTILELNILIRGLNAAFGDQHKLEYLEEVRERCQGFTNGPLEPWEKTKLVARWHELVRLAQIQHPQQCLREFQAGITTNERTMKRNILGCYLGQDFSRARFAADIFNAAVEIISESFNKP